MASAPSPVSRTFTWSEIAFAVAGVALLIGAALALAYASWPNGSGGSSETFRFITLLVIFMAALTSAAGVFVWLRIDNPGEAFALPPGSIRAVLAIAIMILFVVFGLQAVSPLPPSEARLTDTPIRLSVPADRLDAFVQLHRSEGLTVIVTNYGSAAAPAQMSIYAKTKARSPAELDLSKQLLTALFTALTSLTAFYFGGRSTSDASRTLGNTVDLLHRDALARSPNDGGESGQPQRGDRVLPAPPEPPPAQL